MFPPLGFWYPCETVAELPGPLKRRLWFPRVENGELERIWVKLVSRRTNDTPIWFVDLELRALGENAQIVPNALKSTGFASPQINSLFCGSQYVSISTPRKGWGPGRDGKGNHSPFSKIVKLISFPALMALPEAETLIGQFNHFLIRLNAGKLSHKCRESLSLRTRIAKNGWPARICKSLKTKIHRIFHQYTWTGSTRTRFCDIYRI